MKLLRQDGRWALIGLGEMGLPMALNLIRAGVETRVFDASEATRAAAAEAGGRSAASVREAVDGAGVVALVVRDEQQVRDVLHGRDGVLSGPFTDGLVVVHSTIGAGACRRLAAEVADAGGELLDAPVSGMRMRAVDGTLTFLVGGSDSALKRARHGLAAMGERVFHLGPVGAGQAAKIANNAVSLSTVMLVEEAMRLAAAEGVDEARMLEVLEASSGASWIAANWDFIRHRWRREHPLGGPGVADMAGKDLELAVALAAELDVPLPGVSLAADLVPRIVGGDATRDRD
jgi:3-hydroxyisobutyrate dehydrogenase-like beta-hydroxyacid dehydrogenase